MQFSWVVVGVGYSENFLKSDRRLYFVLVAWNWVLFVYYNRCSCFYKDCVYGVE